MISPITKESIEETLNENSLQSFLVDQDNFYTKKDLSQALEKIISEHSLDALYLYGSYVNGYFNREDSDIDIIGITKTNSKPKPLTLEPNLSLHLVHPYTFNSFEIGIPYTHLNMVPIYNKEECIRISDKFKTELVRRELIKFKNSSKSSKPKTNGKLYPLGPIINYLKGYAVQRPWRIKPIKRLFDSYDSMDILHKEYQRVFDILEKKGTLLRIGESFTYKINPNFVFDDRIEKQKTNLFFKFGRSYGGFYYLKELHSIREFSREKI